MMRTNSSLVPFPNPCRDFHIDSKLNIRFSRWAVALILCLLVSAPVWCQIQVKGTVIDDLNLPVPGANVVLKGAQGIGTITDFDGNFQIEVPSEESVLIISFIGYATQEVKVGKQTNLQITLKEDGVMLNEVVAIGYATVKKSDLTGSVEKVDMEELNKTPVTSFDHRHLWCSWCQRRHHHHHQARCGEELTPSIVSKTKCYLIFFGCANREPQGTA